MNAQAREIKIGSTVCYCDPRHGWLVGTVVQVWHAVPFSPPLDLVEVRWSMGEGAFFPQAGELRRASLDAC